jgi:predicted small integral membrane protein
MTPEDRERLAKSRFQTLQLLRFTGIIVMIIGMWVWGGDILREGGWPRLGIPLFAFGLFEALVLPTILAQRWKSPPEE